VIVDGHVYAGATRGPTRAYFIIYYYIVAVVVVNNFIAVVMSMFDIVSADKAIS